jgi:hypothetical protein
LVAVGGLLLAGTVLIADGTRFSDFTPLTASAGPTADEAVPITLGNSSFRQRSIADRDTQLASGIPNSGDWDMNTVNETGAHKGRFLFTVFESDQSGVQRHALLTGVTDTIWHSPVFEAHVSFDPSFWTPWGTLITGEESWETAEEGSTSPYGRLFELKNPIDAPAISDPLNCMPSCDVRGITFWWTKSAKSLLSGVVAGVLRRDELPPELRRYLTKLVESYEAVRAGG